MHSRYLGFSVFNKQVGKYLFAKFKSAAAARSLSMSYLLKQEDTRLK